MGMGEKGKSGKCERRGSRGTALVAVGWVPQEGRPQMGREMVGMERELGGLGKTEESLGRQQLTLELGFDNQELMCILDFNLTRLRPCARCNLSSSSRSKCSPSVEVLALRFWFGPSFHGKLNNHMRERKGERTREKKKTTVSSSKSGKNQNTFWLHQL